MASIKIEDLDILITAINSRLADKDFEEGRHLTLHTNGYTTQIQWLGITLWDSDNDERIYREETDDYENLEDLLMREIDKVANYAERAARAFMKRPGA